MQPTNEAFRRTFDADLLGSLLTGNRTDDVPLLSKLLQFHSVPSPLPLAVSPLHATHSADRCALPPTG